MLEENQLRENFKTWRGRSAVKEAYAIETAVLIARYVNFSNLNDIDSDITAGSDILNHFGMYRSENALARVYGCIVYSKFAIEHYRQLSLNRELLPNAEKLELDALLDSLNSLYNNPYWYPNAKINALLEHIRTWLNMVDPAQKEPLVHSACLSLYALQKILLSTLNQTTEPQRVVLHGYGLHVEKINNLITPLIETTKTKVQTLIVLPPAIQIPVQEILDNAIEEVPIDSNNHAEAPSDDEAEASSDNDSEADVFEDTMPFPESPQGEAPHHPLADDEPEDEEELVFQDALESTQTILSPTLILHTYFDKQLLNLLNNEEHPLSERMRHILIKLNQIHHHLTELTIKQTQQIELETELKKAQIEYEKPAEHLPATLAVRKTLNQAAQTYHAYASAALQNLIPTTTVPITPTPKERATLCMVDLCGSYNDKGQLVNEGKIQQLESQIAALIKQLVRNDHPLKYELRQLKADNLVQLIEKNRTIYAVMTEFSTLVEQIAMHQQYLSQLKGLDANIDTFILKYNTIFVTISLFIAQWLGAWFKTDAADQIERALIMKQELSETINYYQGQLNHEITLIRDNTEISPALTTTLAERVLLAPREAAPERLPTDLNRVTQFTLIDTLFRARPMIPEPAVLEEPVVVPEV